MHNRDAWYSSDTVRFVRAGIVGVHLWLLSVTEWKYPSEPKKSLSALQFLPRLRAYRSNALSWPKACSMHWLAKTGTGSGFIGIELTTHLWPQKTLHTAMTQGPSTWQEVWPCHRHDRSSCLVHGEPCQSQLIWSPTHFPLQLTNQWHNSEVSHSHHYSIHTYSMCRNSPLDRAPHTHTVRTYIPISPTVCSYRQAEWAHEPKQSFYH